MSPARERPQRAPRGERLARSAGEAEKRSAKLDSRPALADDSKPALKPKDKPAEQAKLSPESKPQLADKPLGTPAHAEPAEKPLELPVEVRRQIEDADRRVKTAETEARRHIELARDTFKQNQILSKKVEWLTKAIGDAGFDIAPEALELFEHRTRAEVEQAVSEQLEKARADLDKRKADEEFKQLKATVAEQAKKAGLDPRAVEVEYALAMQAFVARGGKGAEPTVENIVKQLRGEQLEKQQQVSRASPALVVPTASSTSVAIARDKTLNGRLAHLKSRGHDLST